MGEHLRGVFNRMEQITLPEIRDVKNTTKNGVIVAHPSRTLNTYQASLAFQEAGRLLSFETGFYSKLGPTTTSLLRGFPRSLRSPIERELRRRAHLGLRNDLIHSHSLWDLISTLVARVTRNQKWTEKAMYWRNDRFGHTVARVIQQRNPVAVYCYETTAFEAFKACEKVHSIKILEHISGHYETSRRTIEEERILHPEFSEDLQLTDCENGRNRWIQESQMADRIVVPSSFVANTLVEIGIDRSRIMIIPYGVDTESFQPRLSTLRKESFRILFAGRIHPMKGVIYLLEAFKQLKLADAELILLGYGNVSGRGWLPYKGLFRHIARVPYAEMPRYYTTADLFVFPSLHEGSALVTYEALASGLPVITTENAGSVVQNGVQGWIVPIRDTEALKQKIFLMYSDRRLRDTMSHNARKRAEQFGWTTYRKTLVEALNDLI